MRDAWLGLAALGIAACGGATVASGALDAGDDAIAGDDGGVADAAWGFEASGFGDAQVFGDAIAMARGSCMPPCDPGQYCYAAVIRGGGRHHVFGPGDGGPDADPDAGPSPGCHDDPAACAPSATCTCLLREVGSACHASMVDCVLDEAGAPTVECVTIAP